MLYDVSYKSGWYHSISTTAGIPRSDLSSGVETVKEDGEGKGSKNGILISSVRTFDSIAESVEMRALNRVLG